MASHRKPLSRPKTPVDQQPADPAIQRYSLSDTPLNSYDPLVAQSYEDIRGAVDHLLHSNASSSHPASTSGSSAYASASGHSTHSELRQYRPYTPGQSLAPIHTGETLKIEEDTRDTNLFSESRTHLTASDQSHYNDQDYHPPSMYSYVSYEGETLPAGNELYDTSFGSDTEAYTSAHDNSGTWRRPPRSRSPTPAVDDEDYYVVEDGSVYYSGYGRPQDDPEKAMLPRGPLIHNVLYDPEPETPKSSLGTLPETPLETQHFGPAPSGRVMRRNKTRRRVQLTNGNLVIDLPVPPKLVLPRRGEPETTKTRYTAVTCDPDEFEKKGFFLRQNEIGRRTELFIVITMYNEDEILFCRTMYGVMRNIAHLCTRKNSQTWGPNAWQKVVVCIVADGRKKIHPRVLDCLTLLGVYQPGDHMKNMVNNKEVTAHLFEYTTTFALDSNLHFKYPDKGIVPTQIIFCMKEKNQKKINSHRWFFNAFGPMLQPNVCVLLDVGTRPGNNSIYRLWKAFDVNSSVGGACGEISTYKGKNWSLLLNPLVAAQNFEYKISSILDKTTESMFGYISVLPGAFSAYRYIALQNDERGVPLLNRIALWIGLIGSGLFTDLAEDRILCFELVAKTNSNWQVHHILSSGQISYDDITRVLKYVKGAIGETDVPEALPEFISQRRRWLNGSFFAATYAIAHVGQILHSGHSLTRKIFLMVENVYNIINLIFSWFSIGNFYLFFVVLTSSLEDLSFNMPGIRYFNIIVQAAHQGGSANNVMLFSIVITYGLYLVASILAFDPWHMLTSFIPYMFLSPTYINILNIYAFSNLDDISWGTKQDNAPDRDLGAVIQDSHSQVDLEMLTEAADVNGIYEEALTNLKTRKPAVAKKSGGLPSIAEREQAAKDYYARFASGGNLERCQLQ
ncbi:hypothetical protein H0H87_011354 [Tephrocybe sp. NHM501043]|nr:hypothetical protein H0H87_011354 [Tephrocybe sp. NHM501043]